MPLLFTKQSLHAKHFHTLVFSMTLKLRGIKYVIKLESNEQKHVFFSFSEAVLNLRLVELALSYEKGATILCLLTRAID